MKIIQPPACSYAIHYFSDQSNKNKFSHATILQELYKTCKEMQSRVGQLLCTPTTDELTVDMLQINDDLNDLFDRYDRKTAAYKGCGLTGGGTGDAPLIDLGDEGGAGATPSLIQDLGAMNLQQNKASNANPPSKKEDVDFDQFVSSRSTSNPSAKKS